MYLWPIYVNVDSPNLGFPYFNFLGGYQWKNHPVVWFTLLTQPYCCVALLCLYPFHICCLIALLCFLSFVLCYSFLYIRACYCFFFCALLLYIWACHFLYCQLDFLLGSSVAKPSGIYSWAPRTVNRDLQASEADVTHPKDILSTRNGGNGRMCG